MFRGFQNNSHDSSENNVPQAGLHHPTDKERKCGVSDRVYCINYEKGYIGESARTFGTRIKERDNTGRASL